jgi:hypothetical protein
MLLSALFAGVWTARHPIEGRRFEQFLSWYSVLLVGWLVITFGTYLAEKVDMHLEIILGVPIVAAILILLPMGVAYAIVRRIGRRH